MDRACSMYEKKNAYNVFFIRKPDGRRPLGKLRYRWDDSITTNLGARDYRRDMDWIIGFIDQLIHTTRNYK
jgi:hypothetical protein